MPLSEWQAAGRTPSGVGSTQYPVYSETSQYAAPAASVYDPTYGAKVPVVQNIGGKPYEVNVPEGAGWETMLRTIIAAAGGGPGINNVGAANAAANPALVFGGGNAPNLEPGLLGTVTTVKNKKEGGR